MNWDWYSATVADPPDAVIGALAGIEGASVRPARPLYGYTDAVEVSGAGDQVMARAFWGGVNGAGATHVQFSGARTGEGVALLRSEYPGHRVARADVCEDWTAPKQWRRSLKVCLDVATDHRVAVSTAGDWIRRGDGGHGQGRTLYIGGRTSRVRGRLYEKGLQLGAGCDPNWVRFELQVRPTGEGKGAIAGLEPLQLMGAAMWSTALAARFAMPEFDQVRVRDPWQPSDDERALAWCCRQYGGLFQRRAAELGGWEAFGRALGDRCKRTLQ